MKKTIFYNQPWEIIPVIFTALLFIVFLVLSANIPPAGQENHKWSWGENIGWQNWAPTHDGGVTVYDECLVGYVWAENVGWIKLATSTDACQTGTTKGYENDSNGTDDDGDGIVDDWGVNNDGNGNLSGFAWGENIGWINFDTTHSQVTIDSSGHFSGYAWGENVGWINFGLESPQDSYIVWTSWTPTPPAPPTYTLGTDTGQTIHVLNNLKIGDGTHEMTVTGATYNPILDIDGNFTISANATFIAATSSPFTIAGNWSNSGTFTANSGTVTFDAADTDNTINNGSSSFYNLNFSNASGGWTLTANTTTTNNFTITAGAATSTSGTLAVGGNWSATTTGVFQHNNGEVIFFATSPGKTISDGGWPFYKITFNSPDSNGVWLYADSTSTAPATTTVQAGTATFLNAKTGGVSVTGGTLNVDWYLGIHVVDKDATSTGNVGNATCTITEMTASSTVWKHNGSVWGDPAVSQWTLTQTGNASGTIPQPNNAGAIRIREYQRTSSATTTYKYNLEVVAPSGLDSYNYYSVRGGKYITSTSSPEVSEDRCISQDWHRANISQMNGSKDYDGLNEPPQHGSWYAGMTSDLEFSISSPTLYLNLQAISWTATGTTILYATTSYPAGYTIRVHMQDTQGALATSTPTYNEISRWNAPNATPTAWDNNCPSGSSYCGFGYTSSDSSLAGGTYLDRFTNNIRCSAAAGNKCWAGFATSSLSTDPVGDSTSTAYGATTTITYKASVNENQPAGSYTGKVYYICTANY